MVTIRLLGGAKKSFDSDTIFADFDSLTVKQLLDHLASIKPKDTLDLDTKNILVAVNGVDSSALDGLDTVLHANDIVSIIPVIHGGADGAWRIYGKNVRLFCLTNRKGHNYQLLDAIRRKFPDLIIEGVSARSVLGFEHARKVVALSLFAQKNGILLSKKLQTDILLRFAVTRQIDEAIRMAGIENDDDFVLVSIGGLTLQRKLSDFVRDYETKIDFVKNESSLKKRFKITDKSLAVILSKTPLEDFLVERSAVLFK